MNNPLVLLALINSIENMDYTNKQYIIDSIYTKNNTYYNKPSYNYLYKKKNNRSINQPRNRGTNHIKSIRHPKNIIY